MALHGFLYLETDFLGGRTGAEGSNASLSTRTAILNTTSIRNCISYRGSFVEAVGVAVGRKYVPICGIDNAGREGIKYATLEI